MTIFRKAARDISVVTAAFAVMWIATLVFTVAQARYLGPARFGELSLALSYAAFLTFVIDFGLGAQLSRTVAQRAGRHEAALAATMAIRGGLWLLATCSVWLATLVLGYDRELRDAIVVLAISTGLLSVSTTIAAYLQGQEEFLLPSVASVVQRFTVAGLGITMLALGADLALIAGAYVVGALVNLLALVIPIRHRPWVRPRVEARGALRLFRGAVPLGSWFIAATFCSNVGMILLERLAPAENVGWYAAAFRLFGAAAIVPAIVAGVVLYPILSRLSLGSRHELRMVIEKALTFLTLAGIAVALVFVLWAERIVTSLYPAETYAAAASSLRLLALGLPFLYVNAVFIFSLFALHQERRLIAIAIVAVILNPLADLALIPLFGQDAVAATIGLTEVGQLAWLVWSMPRDLLSGESLRVAMKATIAAIVVASLVDVTGGRPILATVPVALALYGVALLAVRAISAEDLRALGALFGRRRAPAAAAEAIALARQEEVA